MLAYCCKTTSKFIYSSNKIILKSKIKIKKKRVKLLAILLQQEKENILDYKYNALDKFTGKHFEINLCIPNPNVLN